MLATTSLWAFVASWFSPASLFVILNVVIGTIFLSSRFGTATKTVHDDHHRLARAPSLLDRVRSINFSLQKLEYPLPQPETLTEPQFLHHPVTGYSDQPGPPTQLPRAPSFLERVKSINYYFQKFEHPLPQAETQTESHFLHHSATGYSDQPDPPAQLIRASSLLERVKSINLSSFYRTDPAPDPEQQFTSETEAGADTDPILRPNRESDDEYHHDHQVTRNKSETRASAPERRKEKMTKSASEKLQGEEEEDEDRESVEKRRPATTRIEKTVSFGDDGVDAKADDFINRFKQQLKLQRLESLLGYKEKPKGK